MVDRLARDRNSLRLGGERRELSFLFTDIAGFTEMSEQLPPEDLTGLLNDYFDGMSDVIAAHHGMIDKFIGDAVVALFGAPTADANHALNAVRAAAAMDAFAEEFRRGHRGQGIGITRIGVHTGMASVGNFGGRKRFDYTAMGDAMNTAARLESVNKTLGTRVTVSGAARAAAMAQAGGKVSDLPTLRPAGRLALKGKAAATEAWNLCDGLDRDLQDDYAAAFALMAAGDLGAAQAFADLAARFPGDPLTALHLRRLQAGQTNDQVGLG
jgi:adenylate cyclase